MAAASSTTAVDRAVSASAPKIAIGRVQRDSTYQTVRATGKKAITYTHIILYLPQPESALAEVGYVTSKKLGSAVVRNRIRRRLREAVRAVMPDALKTGGQYLIIGRKSAETAPLETIRADLAKGLRYLNRITTAPTVAEAS